MKLKRILSALLGTLMLLSLCCCAAAPQESDSPAPALSPSPLPSPSDTPEPTPEPEPDPIDAHLAAMTTEQKVGQLLLAGIEGTTAREDARYAIETVQVGGIILFRRNIESCAQAAALVSGLRALNGDNIPLLISMDEEGGTVSRMPADEVVDLPSAARFGSTEDDSLALHLGEALAAECAAIGVNTDFAPVADIWSNPENTVIGKRAYAAEAGPVSTWVTQVSAGLTSGGVIPVVKHFPGHGDTAVDSHYDLPVVTKTAEELEALELIPFRAAIEAGAPAVMVAHLLVQELDDTLPASLSPTLVDGLLRGELGFDGVVFTDDLTMGAISNTYGMGEAAVLALEAGCDVLLVCHGQDNLTAAYEALLAAVSSGRISGERLDESVRRILTLKANYSLTNDSVPEPDVAALNAQLNSLLEELA